MTGENLRDCGTRENVAKGVDRVAWPQGEEGGNEQSVTIEDQRHFKLAEKFDVLLTVFLRKVFAFEHVGQN